jgi:hypothetical protein
MRLLPRISTKGGKLNLGAYYYIELKLKEFCDYNLAKGLGFR